MFRTNLHICDEFYSLILYGNYYSIKELPVPVPKFDHGDFWIWSTIQNLQNITVTYINPTIIQ
jgi:hypothetical protein